MDEVILAVLLVEDGCKLVSEEVLNSKIKEQP